MNTLFTVALPAKLENLERMVKSVSDCAREQGFDQKRTLEIELAAEEALVNIIHYSYPEKPGPGTVHQVEIICCADEDRFIIELIDSGIAFDMTSLSDPDVDAKRDERKIGGLGVFLIKKMVDEVKYRREKDRNILDLIIVKGVKGKQG